MNVFAYVWVWLAWGFFSERKNTYFLRYLVDKNWTRDSAMGRRWIYVRGVVLSTIRLSTALSLDVLLL